MRLTPRTLPLVLMLAFAPATADSDAATAAFHAGNAAYERGDFAAAADAYARAEEAGASDARLHYNRGNALFRLGRTGPAILQYEKALALAHADADIRHNLAFARARAGVAAPEPSANPFRRAFDALQASYTPRGGILIAFGLFAAMFLLPAAGLFLSAPGRIMCGAAAALSVAGLLAFSPFLLHKLRGHADEDRAVVIETGVTLRSGPGPSHEALLNLPEGSSLSLVADDAKEDDEGARWVEVALPDGRRGYVPAARIGTY